MAPKVTKKSEKDQLISDKYKKLSGPEHVLARPGMYIGSIEEDVYNTWIFDVETKKMIKKTIKYIPGLYKIFDEILVNAIDHAVRVKGEKESGKDVLLVKNIHVNINKETGVFEISNDGQGIEIVKHPEHNIYIPELIFGNMLTSTNYDDSEEKIIGGTNGLGSKCTNIFSTRFEIETVDYVTKTHYHQIFENNMNIVHPPKIEKYKKKPDTTTVFRFNPDYPRFNMKNGLTDDMYDVIIKRVYDTCAVTDNDVNIYLNGEKLEYKNFEKYIDLFLGPKVEHDRVYERINERWEIAASYNDFNGFEQMSFVNGLWTLRGGKHVEYICNQIVKKLTDLIVKKNKNVSVKPQSIKDNLILFVKSTIVNPSFDSQSKETLTTPTTKFGSKGEVSDKFIEKLYKSGIVEKVLEISQLNDAKTLQKTDGKKKSVIRGLPKLEDANWAGTNKSSECILILTEGDSASSMAIAGISEIGRDKYGVFPLKGKILNVRDTNVSKIADNDEITNLKKILGLETGKNYKDVSTLRYGKVMLMTDQDSVTYDTPCLVKNVKNGFIDIKPICELNNEIWIKNFNDKEYSSCDDYLVWSDKGWTKIISVMKHKINKPIHRVLTHTGCVDVTEDHSLLNKNGESITVKDCIVKETELLHNKCYIPKYKDFNTKFSINEELSFAMGYFMADGNCTIDGKVTIKNGDKIYETCNSSWSIDCVEKEPLEKLKLIFEKYECNDENNKQINQNPESKHQCIKCDQYFKDSWALHRHEQNKNDCSIQEKLEFEIVKIKFSKDAYSKREFKYKLQAKVVRKNISEKYRCMFYNSLREKKVPIEILNSSVKIQQSFIDGFYAADGDKGITHTTDRFDGEYKCQMMGLFQILQNCGYKPTVNCSSKKLNVYNVLMSKEYNRPEFTVKKIIDISDKYIDSYVYDFETENHHFHAGIGNMIVHNCDGSHIKGLLFNLFHTMWPSLIQSNNFTTSLMTPIVKVTKGKEIIQFYNLPDYDKWVKNGNTGWNIKYYKGLGTSTAEEAVQYFRDMNLIKYKYNEIKSDEKLALAFDKKKADERKEWIGNFDKNNVLNYKDSEVSYEDFVDKELIHFSNYDVERSIPNMMDGLKISQRKIMFCCFKRNLTDKEIKVAQLAAYVSEHSAYHHGEASLQSTIVGMAQDFVGANNINLLKPNGQYGSRR